MGVQRLLRATDLLAAVLRAAGFLRAGEGAAAGTADTAFVAAPRLAAPACAADRAIPLAVLNAPLATAVAMLRVVSIVV